MRLPAGGGGRQFPLELFGRSGSGWRADSPAFRPGGDLWQRVEMIVCEGVLEPCGFIGVVFRHFWVLGQAAA